MFCNQAHAAFLNSEVLVCLSSGVFCTNLNDCFLKELIKQFSKALKCMYVGHKTTLESMCLNLPLRCKSLPGAGLALTSQRSRVQPRRNAFLWLCPLQTSSCCPSNRSWSCSKSCWVGVRSVSRGQAEMSPDVDLGCNQEVFNRVCWFSLLHSLRLIKNI